jgi:hypothetical protein
MGAAQVQADLYQMRQSGNAAILNPGASGTFDLRGRDLATVTVTATGTYTLPSSPVGTQLLVCCDDTSTVTLADASGTVASFVGTSGTTAARCTATDANSWAVEVVGVTSGGAGEIGIADAGGYTAQTTVEGALQEIYSIPNAKVTTNATVTQVTAAAGHLTGARHVYYRNTADGAIQVDPRTATELFGDFASHYVGYSYLLTFVQTGDNTLSVGAAEGVTVTGTATVATLTTRTFLVTFTSATAATWVCVSKGTIEAT